MKPTIETAQYSLYLGDCREVLASLGPVDAVVTDPPYGIEDKAFTGGTRSGKRTGGNNTWHPKSWWDDEIDPEWGRLCVELSDVVAWFGQWRKREQVESNILLPLRAEIVWAKDCHVGPPCPLAMRDERIWIFGKHSIKGATFETTVWDHPIIPTWAFKNHKNEKPVGLMVRLIRFLNPVTVLDPFMGSGTTGVACIQTGRRFIGCEIEPKYFEIALKRIEAAASQGTLFEPEQRKPVERQADLFAAAVA